MTTTRPFSGPDTATGTANPSSVVIIEDTYAKLQPIGVRARGLLRFWMPSDRLALGPQLTCDAGAPRRRAVGWSEHSVDVERGRQQVGDQIKLGVAPRGDVGVADNESAAAGRIGDADGPRATEAVVVEQAVPMSAEDGVAHDALRFGVDPEPALHGTPGEPPMMDFVSGE